MSRSVNRPENLFRLSANRQEPDLLVAHALRRFEDRIFRRNALHDRLHHVFALHWGLHSEWRPLALTMDRASAVPVLFNARNPGVGHDGAHEAL